LIAYKKEKIENAICFFASEYQKRANRHIPQTILYKMLAFFDFNVLKNTGKPSLELEYRAMKNGPVPIEIYDNRKIPYETECFKFIQTSPQNFIIESKKEPDLDYFSDFELKIMAEIIIKYGHRKIPQKELSNLICDDSHNEIKAWEIAWNRKENSKIEYDDVFDKNIFSKPDSELSGAEKTYLIYSFFLKRINESRTANNIHQCLNSIGITGLKRP